MRNALAHVPKGQHTMVAAAIRQAFLQTDAEAAHQTWRHVADQLRPRWPKLAALMDDSEHDVLAYMTFPAQHRTKLHSTNPLERLNKEVKRRADVVGIFPNEASITRLIGAVLLEQNDEWLLQCRYMQIEGMAELDWVFMALGGRPISGFSKVKARLDHLLAEGEWGGEPWRIHDLRRTMATGLGKLGVSRFVIARVLNHADRTVTGIYDRYEYLEEKRKALEGWGEYLAGLVQLRA